MKVRTHPQPEYSPTAIGLVRIAIGLIFLSVFIVLSYMVPIYIDFSCDHSVGTCKLHQKAILQLHEQTIPIAKIIAAKLCSDEKDGNLIIIQTDQEKIPLSEFYINCYSSSNYKRKMHIVSKINQFLKHSTEQKLQINIRRRWIFYISVPLFLIGMISILGGVKKLFVG
ncbi:MAG: hypothetical protein HF982_03715 [Desulfobacteraceae bacterium]|nr:hypothetical protein [Desulfobacteraceae bacterium]MBC2718693.1 hypothetical protein [Desulfobacteraceae bacterium]